MLDYDREAAEYDRTRGGEPRAEAAAGAVERLLPAGTRVVVDVACGTGIVTRRLAAPGRIVVGVDRTAGMLSIAAPRLPGRLTLGDATALPLASASADAVLLIWILHLLPDAAPVIAEAARVLRPGGVLITTVDKDAAPFVTPSDIADIAGPPSRPAADAYPLVTALGATHGLRPAGETSFIGTGQGRTPRRWLRQVAAGVIPWAPPHRIAAVSAALESLPGQDVPRPDPIYRLIALSR